MSKNIAKYSEGLAIATFFSLSLLLRYILIEFRFPGSLFDLEIFHPRLYGFSFWFPSLGDFILNSILIVYGSFLVFNRRFESPVNSSASTQSGLLRISLFFLILLAFSWFISDLFISLIIDSNISFDISNFTDINEYSILGLTGVALLNFSFFLLCDRIIRKINELNLSEKVLIQGSVLALGVHLGLHHFYGYRDLILVFWCVPIIGTIYYFRSNSKSKYSLYNVIVLLFLFGLFSSHTLLKYTKNKEHSGRERLAKKLAVEKDPITEYKLREIGRKLIEDKFLMTELASGECKTVDMDYYLSENFFFELLSRYEMEITLCYPNEALMLLHNNTEVPCLEFFKDSIIGMSERITDQFYLHDNSSGRTSYCALIEFDDSADTLGAIPVLFIELNSKYIKTNVGFPELLLNGKVKTDIGSYTYAKYKNDQLVAHSGDFPYGLVPDDFIDPNKKKEYVDSEGYNHYVYRSNANNLIVLSKKTDRRLRPFTTLSYLFAFSAIVLLICLGLDKLLKGENPFRLNFKNRILFILIFMSFATVLIVASTSIYYLKDQFRNKNIKSLSEKMSSIIIELEEHLDYPKTYSGMDPEFIEKVLIRRADVFFSDISLFNKEGNLLGTSRKEIFDEGFVSDKMNTNAMHNMVLHYKNDYFQEEQIGGLSYLSSYTPILGENNEPKAFVNLPYFLKHDTLESEISNFLATLLNVYILLLMLSILISILVSNTVSNPLRLLKEKMMGIQLGKSNEEIVWQGDDEIGSLISEYNRMILELGHSASLLAKSERESAWRDMAKQVAHEIKNPLTPMKLNVQQLQRVWNDKGDDWENQLQKFSKSMIEQIDTLSGIASEFSNFAQMPSAINKELNIKEVLSDVLYLFKETENVRFEFNSSDQDEYWVVADKDQLNRVFNNLIKNSIQSFIEEENNLVEVILTKVKSKIRIELKDNGSGISENERDQIFVPNFTTKSSGMGLGLTMVKNIIETAGGTIHFESEIGKGTSFFISLPSGGGK
ncbi:MAG: GHKL domain-containing protein [Flavobacteriales bacterium]|nr:GHKL domain-containing protein [Flavobacteriales bacterium]